MSFSPHQLQQQKVIDQMAAQAAGNALNFSTVLPVDDYEHDARMCLTSAHLPHRELTQQIQHDLIEPLQKIEPTFFYYPSNCLHMTIKNVRVINDPPQYSEHDIETVTNVFAKTVPSHKKFQVYFCRLILFTNNLSIVGTTDPELDDLVLDLDKKLVAAGLPDDKTYLNSQYYISNMTLARFNATPSEEFKQKVAMLSESLQFEPYLVDSVTLLTCNAVLRNKTVRGEWKLQ